MNRRIIILIALVLPFFALSERLKNERTAQTSGLNPFREHVLNVNQAGFNLNVESEVSDLLLLSPELTFFPKKISRKDLLVIIRKNNETANILKYTVTAGSKTIQGNFKGSKTEMKAYLDLVTELKDLDDLQKINVVITDSDGLVLTTTDIPLVSYD